MVFRNFPSFGTNFAIVNFDKFKTLLFQPKRISKIVAYNTNVHGLFRTVGRLK